MRFGAIRMILIGAILAGGSCATVHAQDATMTNGEACTVVLSYLSGVSKFWLSWGPRLARDGHWKGNHNNGSIVGGEPTPTGIRFRLKYSREREVSFEYKDFSSVEQAFSVVNHNEPIINFKPAMQNRDGVTIQNILNDRLAQALNKLVIDAHAGYPYECRTPLAPAEAAAEAVKELTEFQEKTANWRAMNPKPPVSDEVTKKRLLAEDAVQEKNPAAAEGYYRAGITIDPTWAPGWYNAALISAELKNYAAAALDMKHYLILLPDAPDAAAVKEKLLLWEAKAELAKGK